jgi:glycosyltransferase involved in cell wall biosynthesis
MESIVSIIVPVYNTAEYVEECILSILSQSYKNIELILVNDGSTDGSGVVCKKYENLRNVIYIEQENLGTTAARKRGVEESHGEWIMFVDSDDYLLEDSIYGIMDVCESAEIIIAANQRSIESVKKLSDNISRQKYLEMQYARELSAGPWAKLFNKKLFDDNTLSFPKHIIRGEDYLMNLMLAINNQKDVYVYKHQIYHFRENMTSTRHSHLFTLDYMAELSKRGDNIVKNHIPSDIFLQQRVKQRMFFFLEAIGETKYTSNPHHPFVKDIKRCMDEAGAWRPMDRWLLSVSSPWAVKTVWNLRKVWMRLEHPSMILRDIKRLVNGVVCFFAIC